MGRLHHPSKSSTIEIVTIYRDAEFSKSRFSLWWVLLYIMVPKEPLHKASNNKESNNVLLVWSRKKSTSQKRDFDGNFHSYKKEEDGKGSFMAMTFLESKTTKRLQSSSFGRLQTIKEVVWCLHLSKLNVNDKLYLKNLYYLQRLCQRKRLLLMSLTFGDVSHHVAMLSVEPHKHMSADQFLIVDSTISESIVAGYLCQWDVNMKVSKPTNQSFSPLHGQRNEFADRFRISKHWVYAETSNSSITMVEPERFDRANVEPLVSEV